MKKMAFPAHVTEVKDRLKENVAYFNLEKPTLDMLCKLTEPKEETYLKDYEDMWHTIEKHADPVDLEDGHWVTCFINTVLEAYTLPPYAYVSGTDRRRLIKDVKGLSKKLIEKISANDLDAHIILNNERLIDCRAEAAIDGLYIYEDLCDMERSMAGSSDLFEEIRDDEIISFVKLIKVFEDRSHALLIAGYREYRHQAVRDRNKNLHEYHEIYTFLPALLSFSRLAECFHDSFSFVAGLTNN